MVLGVLGVVVVKLVVVEKRQDHALRVKDCRKTLVTQNHALKNFVSLVQVKSNLPLENPAP